MNGLRGAGGSTPRVPRSRAQGLQPIKTRGTVSAGEKTSPWARTPRGDPAAPHPAPRTGTRSGGGGLCRGAGPRAGLPGAAGAGGAVGPLLTREERGESRHRHPRGCSPGFGVSPLCTVPGHPPSGPEADAAPGRALRAAEVPVLPPRPSPRRLGTGRGGQGTVPGSGDARRELSLWDDVRLGGHPGPAAHPSPAAGSARSVPPGGEGRGQPLPQAAPAAALPLGKLLFSALSAHHSFVLQRRQRGFSQQCLIEALSPGCCSASGHAAELEGNGFWGKKCKFLEDYLSRAAAPSTGCWEVQWGQDPAGSQHRVPGGDKAQSILHRPAARALLAVPSQPPRLDVA
ncbi:collagen alpha-1(I) chain-like [Colius striatus]|uniref:collagen alpha-1(I) chain-like n=1 Tax=Colius striatus TaxID=57412 RepID=UPI002B1D72CB|nr:collagen alpha-1(I) chain-like [Colius striatus]